MKVKDLKKGMLLSCVYEEDCFAIFGSTNDKWVMVRARPKNSPYGRVAFNAKICPDTTMIYLGTKKDIDIKMKWTDRFVLIDDQIVGVDPAAWRRIKPVC